VLHPERSSVDSLPTGQALHCVDELWLAYVPPLHKAQLLGQGSVDTFENVPMPQETQTLAAATRNSPGEHATVGGGVGANEGGGEGVGSMLGAVLGSGQR
jgi:hypothetical protein